MQNNGTPTDNTIVRRALEELRSRLPSGWSVEAAPSAANTVDTGVEAFAWVSAPDRRTARLAVEVRRSLDPRTALEIAYRARTAGVDGTMLVVSRYLTPTVRDRLREVGLAYADTTGNVRLSLQEPGLFIDARGADTDPDPEERGSRSLKGPKAGRVVRALTDFVPPMGVRELATRAEVDPGYVSRLLALLDREALVRRDDRGRVTSTDWEKLLRRWAEDAPLESRGTVRSFLDPRGIDALMARLPTLRVRNALTGSVVAARIAPVAPPRLATLYVHDVDAAARELGLRPTDAGANVLLIEPEDEGVFARSMGREGLHYVAVSQAAADLLTSAGRGPAEGEELLRWMAANEGGWRG